jgi:hypothetical protein
MEPRVVYLATVVGGGIIGAALSGLGALFLLGSLRPNEADDYLVSAAGTAFFVVGALFVLVSVIVLPALRAMKREARPQN